MAIATTTPEFFTNVIGTFITESDIGLGAIIGSLMFNTLGVAAVASFAAPKPVQLDWWPITRDSLLYASDIVLLIAFAWDSRITLNETIVMAVLLFFHFLFIFQSKRIMPKIKWFFEDYLNCCRVNSYGNLHAHSSYTHNLDVSKRCLFCFLFIFILCFSFDFVVAIGVCYKKICHHHLWGRISKPTQWHGKQIQKWKKWPPPRIFKAMPQNRPSTIIPFIWFMRIQMVWPMWRRMSRQWKRWAIVYGVCRTEADWVDSGGHLHGRLNSCSPSPFQNRKRSPECIRSHF